MENKTDIMNIPADQFVIADKEGYIHDVKLETKPVGYFRDAFRRFKKNKSSVVAAIIIIILVLFAIIGPFLVHSNYHDAYVSSTALVNYKYLIPKVSFLEGTGIWDGTKTEEISDNKYNMYRAMEIELGYPAMTDILSERVQKDVFGKETKLYKVRTDSYHSQTIITMTLTSQMYQDILKWQDETGLQVILPRSNSQGYDLNPSCWFVADKKGNAKLDANGNFVPDYFTTGEDDYTSSVRLDSDPGKTDPNAANRYRYAQRTGTAETGYNYVVRLHPFNYFQYLFGFEPCFIFGTDGSGYDIFDRLSNGARFSFLLAIVVSAINLTIGAIYGAIEGYYGGAVDMIMERISDILSGVPFTVVTVLFSLHLSSKVGIVPSLLFAFVMTGWIGMASNVRMQFYRFKNQEYVLSARTLGASDLRIMFKHIFPNSLGTIITSCVLVIPGVIFSETSLTYLGIVNLGSARLSSIGSMLSAGQGCMTTAPHVILFPAVFIALLEISFNLFGNGLRDAFNPSLRGSED